MRFGISITAQVVFVCFISVRRIVFWGSSEPFIPSPQGVHPRKWTCWDCLLFLALLSQMLMVRISGFFGDRWDLNWWPCHVLRAWLSTCVHWSASASSPRTIWKPWGRFDVHCHVCFLGLRTQSRPLCSRGCDPYAKTSDILWPFCMPAHGCSWAAAVPAASACDALQWASPSAWLQKNAARTRRQLLL